MPRTRTPKTRAGTIYEATDSFTATIDGKDYQVSAGHTRVREGHPLLGGDRGQFFKPLTVDYDLEDATDGAED